MDVILGGTGRVGNALIERLLSRGRTIKALVRSEKRGNAIPLGVLAETIDYGSADELCAQLKDAETFFMLTPENPMSDTDFEDTVEMISYFKDGLSKSEVERVICLSSSGAQHSSGTGYLRLSNILETLFKDLPMGQVFIRPGYYFSNWDGYLGTVMETGILPTLFPADLEIPMIAPEDVAEFASRAICGDIREGMYEICNRPYSSNDISRMLGEIIGNEVKAVEIPKDGWEDMFQNIGFSPNGIKNFIEMTEAVISGRSAFEGEPITMSTSGMDYFMKRLRSTCEDSQML